MELPEDGGSIFLLKAGIYKQVHAASQPRRPTFQKVNLSQFLSITPPIYLEKLRQRLTNTQLQLWMEVNSHIHPPAIL
jgi:hypothetical protein